MKFIQNLNDGSTNAFNFTRDLRQQLEKSVPRSTIVGDFVKYVGHKIDELGKAMGISQER